LRGDKRLDLVHVTRHDEFATKFRFSRGPGRDAGVFNSVAQGGVVTK
jgi:hypothetical protein